MMKRDFAPAFVLIAVCLAVAALFCSATKAQTTQPQSQKQKAELYVQTGHTEEVRSVALSPDGKILASGGGDFTIKLWSVETGQPIRTLAGPTGSTAPVVFSPDGKILASESRDNTIKLWNVETGQLIKTLSGHTNRIQSLAFSPNGKILASGSQDNTIKLWNVETGQLIKTLTLHSTYSFDSVARVAFSPDGKTLASGGGDYIRLWNAETGEEIKMLMGHTDSTNSIAFSPDSKTLASGGGGDNIIKLWSIETGQPIRTLAGHIEEVWSLAFSPEGRFLASGSQDNTIKLWNVETGRLIKTLTGHTSFVLTVMFLSDGKTLASGSQDNTIKLWNAETGQEIKTLTGQVAYITDVVFSPDNKTLAFVTKKTIKLWSVETGQLIKTLTGHTDSTNSIAFSPDSKTLASGGADNTIRLWSLQSGQEIRTFRGHTEWVRMVEFSPDGKILASESTNDTIKLWNVETGQELSTLTRPANGPVVFSPDGKTLASGSQDNTIKLWNAETGQEIKTLKGHTDYIAALAFSPDGKTLASGSEDNTIKLWNVETGRLIKNLMGHTAWVGAVMFSPDGKTLASDSLDDTMRLWNVKTGRQIKSLGKSDSNTMRELYSVVPDIKFSTYSPIEPITKDGRFQIKLKDRGQLDWYDLKMGKLLASLIAIGSNDWAVVTPDGLFDGSPNAWKLLSWRLSDKLYDIAPVEAFFNEFYRPGLLQDIFAGRKIEKPTRDISTIDIRQPEVKVKLSDANQNAAHVTERQVTVNIEIKDAPPDSRRAKPSGAKDVRLFRNGSLVKVWRGDVLKGKGSVTLSATVPVIAGDNTFTAYAFNNNNVKSRDAELRVKGAESLKRKGTAYVLTIGVDKYDNSQYNLRFAVADAQLVGKELKSKQEQLGIYERVEVIELINENAKKEKIIKALTDLRAQTQPEDAVLVYFAGHGTAQGNRFYLLPHDLGYEGDSNKLDEAGLKLILARSISDLELEAAFEGIDAGQLLMVLDACNSGQALEAEEKRRGPMNSKGLAQLAYEKGMYILTAAQSFQAAKEASQIGHGLLTYALIEEGLNQAVADSEPKDGQVLVREWFDYATRRVPGMQVEKMKAARDLGLDLSFKEEERDVNPAQRTAQQPRVFYRRELEQHPLVVAKPRASQPEQ